MQVTALFKSIPILPVAWNLECILRYGHVRVPTSSSLHKIDIEQWPLAAVSCILKLDLVCILSLAACEMTVARQSPPWPSLAGKHHAAGPRRQIGIST